jgi:hypothetical protein
MRPICVRYPGQDFTQPIARARRPSADAYDTWTVQPAPVCRRSELAAGRKRTNTAETALVPHMQFGKEVQPSRLFGR